MCKGSNLVKRHGSSSYYVRVAVPVDVQHLTSKREVWRSLGTSKLAEARRRKLAALKQIESEFHEMRARSYPTDDELQRYAREFYEEQLKSDYAERRAGFTFDLAPSERDTLERELRRHLATCNYVLVYWAADEIIRTKKLAINMREIDSDSDVGTSGHSPEYARLTPEFERLCHFLLRAQLEIVQRQIERDAGKFYGQPQDPVIANSDPMASSDDPSVMDAWEKYAREQGDRTSQDWLDVRRDILKLFAEHVGENMPVSALTKKHFRTWKEKLYEFPTKAAQRREYEGLTFHEIIDKNRRLNHPTLGTRSLNKYISAAGTFFKWCVNNGYMENNIADGQTIYHKKNKTNRHSFKVDQLDKLFRSPLFTGCKSDSQIARAGDHLVRDHRYWAPLIALFSGARLGEIVQLDVADIKKGDDGGYAFHLIDGGDGEKRLKSEAARRVVPVHNELVRLGLLDHVKRQKKAKHKKLFPGIKPDSRGFLSGPTSHRFNQYLRTVGVKETGLVFHSFRHTFIDALRRAEITDIDRQTVIGHAPSGVTAGYGQLTDRQAYDRHRRLVDAVEYPGLDLSHLRTRDDV